MSVCRETDPDGLVWRCQKSRGHAHPAHSPRPHDSALRGIIESESLSDALERIAQLFDAAVDDRPGFDVDGEPIFRYSDFQTAIALALWQFRDEPEDGLRALLTHGQAKRAGLLSRLLVPSDG